MKLDIRAAAAYIEESLRSRALTFEDVARLIYQYQVTVGLDPDGKPGPRTLARLRPSVTGKPIIAPGHLEAAGRKAISVADGLWKKNIVDLPTGKLERERCRATIDDMIRSQMGLHWSWMDCYDLDTEWCGAFAAFCWGDTIPVEVRRVYFASTYRLDRWASYRSALGEPNPQPDMGPRRGYISLDESSKPGNAIFSDNTGPRAGDILLVGPGQSAYGKHVTLVESFDPIKAVFHTIEGNGTGRGPNGNRQHGVIRHERPLGLSSKMPPTTYHARRLIRPSPLDVLAP